jgi:hypothetical protein
MRDEKIIVNTAQNLLRITHYIKIFEYDKYRIVKNNYEQFLFMICWRRKIIICWENFADCSPNS